MDKGDISHITLWFLSNYSLMDFMNEDRFIKIYKNQIGSSRKQLQYAMQIRAKILNTAKIQFKETIKSKEEEKPKPKETIELEEKPSIVLEEKPSIILEEKPKEIIELEEKPKEEEKPSMKEKISEVKPSLGQRIRAFIKKVFRI